MATETSLPLGVTDDGDERPPKTILVRQKCPPAHEVHVQDSEQVCRYLPAVDVRRFPRSADSTSRIRPRPQCERTALLLHIEEIRIGEPPRFADRVAAAVECDESV